MKHYLLLSLLLSTQVFALPWSTDYHHIEPVMNEAMEAIEGKEDLTCASSTASPITYISDHPKTEPWRKYYKVPKLLTNKFYKVRDVCEEAKRMNAAQGVTKKYALIANKTHLCDSGHRACLATFKSVSDPCNNFVQDNFQVFHSRTFIGQHRPEGYKDVMNEYGNMGPSLLVIDLATCELMPTVAGKKALKKGMSAKDAVKNSYYYTPPSMDSAKDAKGEYKFKSEDESVRFDAMRESLTANIPELKPLESGKKDCFVDGKRTLPGIGDLESVPYGEMKLKGAIGLRKLMDEQYIQETGINPYKK